MYSDQFAYIPTRLDFAWERGRIQTSHQFDTVTAWFQASLHPDGHLYQIQNTVTVRQGPEVGEPLPKSKRGALLFSIPATHELTIDDLSPDPESPRNGLGGFVIHFLGFLLGRRCQFADWFFDVRLASGPHSDARIHSPERVGACLNTAFAAWEGAPDRTRTVLTNALYMHNRAPSYEWSWERFIPEYQVFDALFSVASGLHGVTAKRHKDRFLAVCDEFGLWYDKPIIERIVDLRNDLFHEVLWGGEMPGAAVETDVYYAPIWLHYINQRLGMAVLGLTGPYLGTNWRSQQTFFLDLDLFAEG